jgi:simple sugar transport system ATP-binding protein
VQSGEIVGITGLLGSGRSELALSLCGLKPAHSGTITIGEKDVFIRNVRDAIKLGLAYVPEDRLTEGLFLDRSVESNLLSTTVGQLLTKWRLLDRRQSRTLSRCCIDQWDIKTPDTDTSVKNLSGGNQQKVVLAKWLATEAKILILNGPTVGVDIGAKMDIHGRIRWLAKQGLGILVMSDDISELVQICHRILLMHKGRIIDQLQKKDLSEELIQNKLNQLT